MRSSSQFHGVKPWPRMRSVIAGQRVTAAVAYVGKGSATYLPFRSGSTIVVDASDLAVKSGQTCPAELLKWHNMGVHIHSCPGLHAKVFVVGKRAFVGSANLSRHSSETLIEAVIESTDRRIVRQARDFVLDQCGDELFEHELKRRMKLYRPPIMGGGHKRISRKSQLPDLTIMHTRTGTWTVEGSKTANQQRSTAREEMSDRSRSRIDEFEFIGSDPRFFQGQKVMQIGTDEDGTKWVYPPGRVLHMAKFTSGKQRGYILYLEVPKRRRKAFTKFRSALPLLLKKRLRRNGAVAPAKALELIRRWN